MSRRANLLVCASLILAVFLSADAHAQSIVEETLPDKILKREIELQKINGQLNLNAGYPSFQRARRTWAWDYLNALPTEAGLISATSLFHGHSSDKIAQSVKIDGQMLTPKLNDVHNHAPDSKVAGTIVPQIVGQVIGASGAVFELSADYSHSRHLRKLSLNYKAVSRRVSVLNNEIDDLLRQYQAQTVANPEAQALELSILTGVKDIANRHFEEIESSALCNSVGRIIEDSVSATRNIVGTIGNSINISGIMRNSKRENGRGSILNLASASMITVRPFISNMGSHLAKKISYDRTNNLLNSRSADFEQLSKNVQELKLICDSNLDPNLRHRLNAYNNQLEIFHEDTSLQNAEAKKIHKLDVRRYRESIYGPSKIAQSTCGIVANYRNLNNATVDNRLAAAANLTYMSGQAFNIMELTRERVVDEREHSRKKANGLMPETRIKENIERLERMY